MPKASYFIGKISLAFVAAVGETAILLALGAGFFGLKLPSEPGKWFTFAWVFVLGVTACSLMGIAYSRLPRTERSAAAVVNPPFIVLQFISGVWILQTQIPPVLRTIASFFPLKWMAQGFRSVFLPDGFAAVEPTGTWQHPAMFAVLVAWCIGRSSRRSSRTTRPGRPRSARWRRSPSPAGRCCSPAA
jgi:ABC-2 type transport system permease protein